MRAARSATESNTTARPVCCSSAGDAAECLITAPRGQRLPYSTAIAPCALIGRSSGRITSCACMSCGLHHAVAERAAADHRRREIEELRELGEQPRHAAGIVEMLHVVLARRLQVDQHRHLAADPVEFGEVDRMAGAAGDRREMDDAVGRAADRLQHDHGVAQRGRRDDVAGQRRAGYRHCRPRRGPDASAERTRSACGAGIEAAKGNGQAQRLGDDRHGAGGAHHHAGADRRRQPAVDQFDLGIVDVAGAIAPTTAGGSRCRRRASRPCGARRSSVRPEPRPSAGRR